MGPFLCFSIPISGKVATGESASRGGLVTTFTFRLKKFNSRDHDSKNSEIEAVLACFLFVASALTAAKRVGHFGHCTLHVVVIEIHLGHLGEYIMKVVVHERH